MPNYVDFNEKMIRFTGDDGSVIYIPKTLGNVDYEAYLAHEETAEDREAQALFDAEQAGSSAE